MKTKLVETRLGILAIGIVLTAGALGMVLPANSVAAREPAMPGVDTARFSNADASLSGWVGHSIVDCAAETMGISANQVVAGLRQGSSVKAIGIRAGVRPAALENGILRCERNLLVRKVDAGELAPHEARRIFNFLSAHITRIINYSWNPVS